MFQNYDKLVRDNIPDLIEKDGNTCITLNKDMISGEKFNNYIRQKVIEELDELKQVMVHDDLYASNCAEDELVDILESMSYYLYGEHLTEEHMQEIYAMVRKKAEHKGVFDKGIILREVCDDRKK